MKRKPEWFQRFSPKQTFPVILTPNRNRWISFGLIGDTHLTSKFCDEGAIRAYYRDIQRAGIRDIFHAGDVWDGCCGDVQVYRGQIHDVDVIGFGNGVRYVAEHYPDLKNMKTHFILGNHDARILEREGANFGEALSQKREDLHYLQPFYARILLSEDPQLTLDLIHLSGGVPYCYDEETEILTNNGWKFFKNLTKDDKVAAFDLETEEMRFELPSEIIDFKYNGEMIFFRGTNLNLIVNPEHKMLVKRKVVRKELLKHPEKSHIRINEKWKLIEAKEILNNFSKQKWRMRKSFKWNGKEQEYFELQERRPKKYASKIPFNIGKVKMNDWLEFLGWYISEGYTGKKGLVAICQSRDNHNYWNEIRECLDKLNLKYSEDERKFRIYSTQIQEWLDKNVGKGAYNKKIPKQFKDLSIEHLNHLLDSLMRGDGWFKDGKYAGYASVSKELLDDVQEIGMKCGYTCTVTGNSVNFHKNVVFPHIVLKPKVIDYKGKIYGVTVSTGIIVVRRHGSVLISGNSIGYSIQKYIRNVPPSKRADIYGFGHTHHHQHVSAEGDDESFLVGGWQNPSEFNIRRGAGVDIGGYKVRVKLATNPGSNPMERIEGTFMRYG